MEEWKTYKLGQIARVQTGPFGSQLHQSDYVDEGVPCIMPVNIGNGLSLLPDGIAKVTEDDANRLSKHRVNAGDIVYSRRGDIERCAFISKEQEGWLCGTGCLRVCDFVPGINPQFIAYCLSLPSTKAWLVSNAVGTTMLNLNTSILSDISLSIPDFDTQNKIVRIIDSFDSKIGINNRINHNLEEQAKTLYKSWFVDFEPFKDNEFVESKLGMIPAGWSVKKAEDICNINIGKTPPRKEHQWFSKNSSDVTWISISDMGASAVFISDSFEMLTKEACKRFNVIIVPEGTVLLSFKLTVGRVSIAAKDLTTNEAIARFLTPSDALRSYLYLTLKLYDYGKLGSTSSIATAVNSKIIKGMSLLCPPADIIERFGSQVTGMFNTIKTLQNEIKCLCEQRESLLPRLMSGEITC